MSEPRDRAARGTSGAVLVVGALALAMWWPTVAAGGLVSDDYLLYAFLGETADGTLAVDWGSVFADFARPWAGLESDFYRPLLSVSLAVDLALGGGSPWMLHFTEVLMHAAVAVMAAVLCALYAPTRAASAALLGGALVAIHPIAVEPVCWIAARNSELEVCFRTLAMLAFAWHLKRGGRAARLLALAMAGAAFASKESAVVLPVALLALDLLDRLRRPWSERWRLHAPFAVLVVAYFGLRVVLFGHPIGAGGPGVEPNAGAVFDNFLTKLAALGADAASPGAWALCVAFTIGIVAALRDRNARAAVLIGGLWLSAQTAPTWALAVGPDLAGSRLVYGLLPPLAILTTAVLLGPAGPRRVLRLVIGVALVGLAVDSRDRIRPFATAWAEASSAEQGIAALADRSRPDRPLALCAMPVTPPGVPPNNPNAWFPFAERPIQAEDLPVVSLGYLTVPVPRAESLLGDASAVRALWHAGAPLATWRPGVGFAVRQRTDSPSPPALAADADAPGTFRFRTPTSPDLVEVLDLDGPTEHAASGGRLIWLTPVPELPPQLRALEFGPGAVVDGRANWSIDVSHELVMATLATLELPLFGFRVELDDVLDDGAERGLQARARARVPELPFAHRPLEGELVTLEQLEARLIAPAAPPGCELRLILLGPQGALPLPCTPERPVALPDGVGRDLEVVSRLARRPRVWLWFEARTPTGKVGFARSAIDHFELPHTR